MQYRERVPGEETRGACFGRSDDVDCNVRGGAPTLDSDRDAGEHFRGSGFGIRVNVSVELKKGELLGGFFFVVGKKKEVNRKIELRWWLQCKSDLIERKYYCAVIILLQGINLDRDPLPFPLYKTNYLPFLIARPYITLGSNHKISSSMTQTTFKILNKIIR